MLKSGASLGGVPDTPDVGLPVLKMTGQKGGEKDGYASRQIQGSPGIAETSSSSQDHAKEPRVYHAQRRSGDRHRPGDYGNHPGTRS
ncbi:hypothetical protein ES703_85092 [subsurface metagenome]